MRCTSPVLADIGCTDLDYETGDTGSMGLDAGNDAALRIISAAEGQRNEPGI
jgi:hypothetical protein